jgi:hypothetical protein
VSLTAEDLAFMRATQAEFRPTPAVLFRRTSGRTASGGQSDTFPTDGDPIQVRIDGNPDRVPAIIGDRLAGADAVKITLDQARDVRQGDQVRVTPAEVYTLVSEGDPDRWATAQVVWARRTVWPARA